MGRVIGAVQGEVEATCRMLKIPRVAYVRGAAADHGLIAIRVVGNTSPRREFIVREDIFQRRFSG
jgi:hypothetical protein